MSVFTLAAQEVITDLEYNPLLRASQQPKSAAILKSVDNNLFTPVVLPFFDDFSSEDMYPSQLRWLDKYAFINATYAINPPNIGTATLDAINEKGEIYPGVIPGPMPFIADYLTSRPVRLDSVFDPVPHAMTVGDSVYLSFYFQPQGHGNPPESTDSLVLEFGVYTGDSVFAYMDSITVTIEKTYYPNDTILLPCPLPDDSVYVSVNPWLQLHNAQLMLIAGDIVTLPCDSVFEPKIEWDHIWSTPGMALDTNFYKEGYPLSYFHQVMIPITDSARYFSKYFVFRFKNYVSLADNSLPSWQSNVDHWNIDFVYLDMNRKWSDTTYSFLSFVDAAPGMLRRYEAMPYKQYMSDPITEMKDSIDIVITNLDTLSHNSTYKYILSDEHGVPLDSCLRGNWDIPPVYTDGYLDYINFSRPPVCFGFYPVIYNADSASFTITHILSSGTGSSENLGDTIRFRQNFYNYYAYDDGLPEAGYGLTPAGSLLAYRFILNKPDTLRAVQMYFNETRTGANQQYFSLMVWNDDNGLPGQVIYSKTGLKPQYSKSLSQFYTYYCDSVVPVVGPFYVGWAQTTSDNLNIGFDRNRQAQENIFYNVAGTWTKSIQQGSLLMRPLLGKSIHDYPVNIPVKADQIAIYPNPAKYTAINLMLPPDMDDPAHSDQFDLRVYNIMGQSVYNGPFEKDFNISSFDNGIYILTVRDMQRNKFCTGKLIISR